MRFWKRTQRRREHPKTSGDELAATVDQLGLWRGLSVSAREESRRFVSTGGHPWSTEIAHNQVQFDLDGEDLAEGGVEECLSEFAPALKDLGVHLQIRTVIDAQQGPYVISINDVEVDIRQGTSFDVGATEDSYPWLQATVRPIAVVNRLLSEAGAVERIHVLYPGGNDSIGLLIDPAIVDAVVRAGFDVAHELPAAPI